MAIRIRIYGTLLLSFLLLSTLHAFYLPGVAPRDFQKVLFDNSDLAFDDGIDLGFPMLSVIVSASNSIQICAK